MLSLTKPLPDSFKVNGEDWTIDLSFDNVLRWYELLDDDEVDDYDKVLKAFAFFIGTGTGSTPETQVEVVSKISAYVQQTIYGDHDEPETDLEGTPMPQERFFSYDKDADAIYSSFMADYHIDLIDAQGSLRWEKFKALFDGLSDQTKFQQIISIRQRSPNGLEGEELTSLIEAQEYYRLDDKDSQDRLDQQMGDVFSMLSQAAEEG
ncbi:Gp15 family bacteriophage protein [Lactiplantibacillus mudanjiangensis]|uniref:Bacteriophage Gp15 protein n=1 Tax=Lactiplantibacillus mudanjiangensis TaxID=1296538 RepID=A0A660DXJ4_9LACO|nr:Gp15 family bacteriophage protein [Lactiplantibacillus mudanjiangensis]VDG26345.1 hypothetical protein [Lactobacillus plantarum subsp. plantarum] [Lactiplantibacillus mudanjiangensis]VDG27869.1 hypothetical protein [Lactobacillus plantarum subsp. plantarum] [Lactiplantibacillus mudanjiangensis]